jgi:hypothetical protein
MSTTWNPVVHEALSIRPVEIFDAYFRRDPPFDKPESKEFPDAFVIATLDRWCEQQRQQMRETKKGPRSTADLHDSPVDPPGAC